MPRHRRHAGRQWSGRFHYPTWREVQQRQAAARRRARRRRAGLIIGLVAASLAGLTTALFWGL